MRIAMAQINPTVGDVRGNLEKHKAFLKKGMGDGVDLVVFPELSLSGYPPKDLLLQPDFLAQMTEASAELIRMTTKETGVLFGTVVKRPSGRLQNCAMLALDGRPQAQSKRLLPTYDVFDEARYFEPDDASRPMRFKGSTIGVCVCEDIWNDKEFWKNQRLYATDPVDELVANGADFIVNISASPFSLGKPDLRREMLAHAAQKHKKPVLYVNQVGGNDDVVYDGRSVAFNSRGTMFCQCKAFDEDYQSVSMFNSDGTLHAPLPPEAAEIHDALVMGTRDYVRKCGFGKAVIGLSGGIDSAVVAAIAAEALGRENVLGISMPSEFSSEHSVRDSIDLANALGINWKRVSIGHVHNAYLNSIGITVNHWKDEHGRDGHEVELWEENLQARIRGAILMSYSNKHGHMVLTTGNKSEVAMGYCTLYGDTCGGLAVISDVLKTKVYDLARHINKSRGSEIIPESTITKAPSAELRPGQFDQQSLPPYDVLDRVLSLYIEEGKGVEEIQAETRHDLAFIKGIVSKVIKNEYKRQQLAPGLRITRKAFGCGRVMPIAQGFRHQ